MTTYWQTYAWPVEALQITRPWGACVARLKAWGVDCFAQKDGRAFNGVFVYGCLNKQPYGGGITAREGDWVAKTAVGLVVVPGAGWNGAEWK